MRLQMASGELALTEGRLVVRMQVDPARIDLVRVAVERLRTLETARFLVPEGIEPEGAALVVRYPAERPGTESLATAATRWRREPQAHVPCVVALARFLADCARFVAFPYVSPAHVRVTPGVPDPFRLLVLPAGEATLADWAAADPDAWLFAAPETLLGNRLAGMSYAVGAALQYGFLGDPFPATLGARERFQRHLRGRAAAGARLRREVLRAVPGTFTGEAEGVQHLVQVLTSRTPEERPTDEEVLEATGRLEAALSPHRVAARWEFQGNPRQALAVLKTAAETRPANEVPWLAFARVLEQVGDVPSALQAGGAAARVDPDGARGYAELLLRTRAKEAQDRARLRPFEGVPIDDWTRLIVAHLEARRFDAPDAALARLEAPCTDPLSEAVRTLLIASIQLRKEKIAEVSLLGKNGRAALDALPATGGRKGRYARGYLALVDGVANYFAVARFKDPSFLSDAFQRLVIAADDALSVDHEGLRDQAVHWLKWIAAFAQTLGTPAMSIVQQGIEASLAVRSLTPLAERLQGMPPLPDYDEVRLFASGPQAEREER